MIAKITFPFGIICLVSTSPAGISPSLALIKDNFEFSMDILTGGKDREISDGMFLWGFLSGVSMSWYSTYQEQNELFKNIDSEIKIAIENNTLETQELFPIFNDALKDKFNFDILKKAYKIGLPVAVQEIAMCGAMVATTMIVAPLGAVAIAANSFAITAESLCYMPGYGIGSAATTLVGRNVGARNFALAKRYGNICTAMGGIFMGLTGAVMMLLCPFVFMLLTPVKEVQALAVEVLRIGLLSEALFGVSIVAAGALRGTGDTLVPSIMNFGSIWVVRIGLALLLVKPLGLHGVWIAMAVELCVRGLLLLFRQKTSRYYSG